MKNKYLALAFGLALCSAFSSAAVQAQEQETQTESVQETEVSDEEEHAAEEESVVSEEAEEQEFVYGEVTAVGESSITIEQGTLNQGGENGQEPPESEAESEEGEHAESEDFETEEAPSMLTLTGETVEITVTEDTVLTRQRMGGGTSNPGNGNEPGGEDSGIESLESEMTEGADTAEDGTEEETGGLSTEILPKPEENSDGQPPELPENGGAEESEEIHLEDISQGDTVRITFAEDGSAASVTVITMGGQGGFDSPGSREEGQAGGPDGAGGGPGGTDAEDVTYTAAAEYTESTEVSGESIDSSGTDENAVLVSNSASVLLEDMEIVRESSDSAGGDASSFYGVGAAVLAMDDGTALLDGGTVTTNAAGGAGLFAYGSGTIYARDLGISTAQDTSGGIHVAGGGTLYAWDLTVNTDGESSAAIRSDRGSGTMVVDGGSYTSNGVGSPAVYSTADITVNGAELTANGSEAVCIEGLNSVFLFDCDLTGNMSDQEQNDCAWNIILYQSMSGDSTVGNSTFQASGGTITAKNGGMFYTTNTESTITLSDVEFVYADENDFFLRCTGNENTRGWGSAGSNGADCLFTAVNQEMEGNVIWDSISCLDFYITDGSALTGAVLNDETFAGEGGDGYCSLYIDADSQWTVTGDSTLTSLFCEGAVLDETGNTVTIQGIDGTVYVEGSSEYTVTVENYQEGADLSGASSLETWEEREAEKPEEFL